MRLSLADWRLGAIYVLSAKRKFSKDQVVCLLIERSGMKQHPARQLADHWFTTEKFRA